MLMIPLPHLIAASELEVYNLACSGAIDFIQFHDWTKAIREIGPTEAVCSPNESLCEEYVSATDGIVNRSCDRVEIINLARGHEYVDITSDHNKFYACTHFGMCGEGVIEVGYSSVNGAPGPGFNPECVEHIREHIDALASASDITNCSNTDEAMTMLWSLAYNADRAYNQWLTQHQGEY